MCLECKLCRRLRFLWTLIWGQIWNCPSHCYGSEMSRDAHGFVFTEESRQGRGGISLILSRTVWFLNTDQARYKRESKLRHLLVKKGRLCKLKLSSQMKFIWFTYSDSSPETNTRNTSKVANSFWILLTPWVFAQSKNFWSWQRADKLCFPVFPLQCFHYSVLFEKTSSIMYFCLLNCFHTMCNNHSPDFKNSS